MGLAFKRLQNVHEIEALRKQLQEERAASDAHRVRVCCGTACQATGSLKLVDKFEKEAAEKGVTLEVVKTGCQGFCQRGPVVVQDPQEIFYQKVKADDVPSIFSNSLLRGIPYRKQLYRARPLDEPNTLMKDIPFYKKQKRVALHRNGIVDPCNIYDSIREGGYAGLAKALSGMTPEAVIEEVKKADLRGRGGAGFPAGVKWEHSTKAKSKIRAVICNGDEGDPGAFMDRALMEGDPHSVLEGMIINAFAIGAQHGYIYVRHEYPLAVKNLGIAIEQAKKLGLLGKNILESGLDFDIEIKEGAGAFVCGESTALVASLEGERGMPRPRPPRLSEPGGGLWNMPTNLNNVETFANVPVIIAGGAAAFKKTGTEKSPGTKVFALTGKIKNTGLIEVPMGITLREIIEEIGGGIENDKPLKAVQTGGPSGGSIPAAMLDLSVDYESLAQAGSIMGSGGMIVLDSDDCMVNMAKYFVQFTQAESCGKCVPCRVGTKRLLEILERIVGGHGRTGDIERLETLGRGVKAMSLCGLGQTAPNPVLSSIRHFRDEFEIHIRDKKCPAKVCKALLTYSVNKERCKACGLCLKACPAEAVTGAKKTPHEIDPAKCVHCGACFEVCKFGAVDRE
ncbi:MAG TPA: NADH-quinone oxidoreductase subunit F [Nitrospiraceae bacterium]|nr:NADH-quinone oxidoreductase subunit F [Nitrospiraceae bacterium]